MEQKIREVIEAAPGAKSSGSRHSSLCSYDIKFSAPSDKPHFDVDRRVIQSTEGTPFTVASMHFRSPLNCHVIFYSTIDLPAFVEPLRRKMVGN
jgi:hypothetical protein